MTDFRKKVILYKSNVNSETWSEYFKYQNPSCLLKEWHYEGKFKNKRIINKVNNALDELRNAVDTEEILNNKNSEKIIGIAEEILSSSKQPKGK